MYNEQDEHKSAEEMQQSREGYDASRTYNREYRPRFGEQGGRGGWGRRPQQGYNRFGNETRSYNNEHRGYGYSHRGFGEEGEQGYRPRFNKRPYQNDGERSNRPYGARQGQGFGGYNREQQGAEGGYQPRPYQPREGGYRKPFNRGGFKPGGYNPHAKYSQKKRLEYQEANIDPNAPIRLNKFLANSGVCSRRDADKYIESGVVSVNGVIVTELGTKVLRTDVVKFHDDQVKAEKKVYVLLNKPKGYVTTSEDPQNRKTVMDLVKDACPERIYPVGRLDRTTTGVLLLTNDGDMASKLTHPKYLKKKIYHVHLDRNVTLNDLKQIAEGITLEDGDIKADAVEYASPTDKKQVGIEIHSGRNRIVRRIFESLGYTVVKLDRVYFAGLTKKNVRRGDWRYLTEKEVNMLRMGAFE